MNLLPIHTLGGDFIDRAIIIYFKAPHSFTGEDIIEIHPHGSRAVIKLILQQLAQIHGMRPAEPGEFTKRAFYNNKMNLVEAEGLGDLINSENAAQHKLAINQLNGAANNFYESLRLEAIEALALLEACIDFPDEEIPDTVYHEVEARVAKLSANIEAALASAKISEIIRNGVRVAILGAPNSGKSSLLNKLAERDIAIVSDIPGTTRDSLEAHLVISGLEFIFIDTAGLRQSSDVIEAEGIRRSIAHSEAADLKIVLFAADKLASADEQTLRLLGDNAIAVISKSDLLERKADIPEAIARHNPLFINTIGDNGIDGLVAQIEEFARKFDSEDVMITQVRHHQHLHNALKSLKEFQSCGKVGNMIEIRCEELRQSALEIGRITGRIDVDELLEVIFNKFCIGK